MSVTNNNLDLTQIPSEDADKLANEIENFYKGDATIKSNLSWHWERNHLFLDGKQWLVNLGGRESATGQVWQPLQVTQANEHIPRPVTNYMFDIYQTLKSYLLKNKPRITVYPNTQAYRDKTAAKLGTLVSECNWERLKENKNYEQAGANALVYGTVFKKSYWNTDTAKTVKVPRTEMQPSIDPATGQQIGMAEKPVLDEFGEQITDYLPLGDLATDIVEAYRMCIDPLAQDLHKARWLMEYSIQPLNVVRDIFGKQENGYTGRVDELQAEKKLNTVMQRFYNLKQSTGIKYPGVLSEGANGTGEAIENTVVLKEYYEKPSVNYPKGRLIVVGNRIPLYIGESPYEGDEEGDWHPYSEFRWELVPGRFWGKGPFDDGVEIQKNLNSIDSLIILNRKTMAVPQKLVPVNSGVAPGSWTGRPGQEVHYRADPSGAKPETIPGVGLSDQVWQERAMRLEDLKQVTGAIDILKGDRPPGVTAASALNMLYEVGTGKLYPVLDRWKDFVESDQKKQLKIVSKRFKEPRQDFIKMLQRKNTELSPQEISHFIGSDLYDNCNVIIEAGSNVPKLHAAKQAALQETAQTGALELQNPNNRIEYLRQMGISGFDNDVAKDIKRAQWENDMMDDTALSPDNHPIILACDEDAIHLATHNDRMKEPSFMALSQEAQQAYMAHVQEHEAQQMQKQQAQMMQAMAMGMPGMPPQGGAQPQPQQGKPPGMPSPSKGPGPEIKGPTHEQKNALKSDMLQPAPIGGK